MTAIRDRDGNVLYNNASVRNPAQLVAGLARDNRSFENADLSGLDLSGVVFEGCDFRGASFKNATLRQAVFRDCDLTGADLGAVNARGLEAVGCRFSGARLAQGDFADAAFARSSLSRAIAGGVDPQGGSLGADFSGASFSESSFTRGQFGGASFRGATLDRVDANGWSAGRADFSDAVMASVDMRSGHMRGASFDRANIGPAQMDNSDFRETSFVDSRVSKTSLTDSVFSAAKIHRSHFRESRMTGLRASRAHVSANFYADCTDLPKEMHADRYGDRVARALAKGMSYASLGGVFAGGFLMAPDSVVDSVSNNPMVGRGATGMVTMMGANMVMRKLAPQIEKHVIGRIETALSKAAPGVSRASASVPLTEIGHRVDQMHFAHVTGMNERRVNKLVNVANRQEDKKGRDQDLAAAGVIGAPDGTQVLVARDKGALKQVHQLLSKGNERVVILRLDENGKPRETGPGLYEYTRDNKMTAVWFHRGEPDFATQFGPVTKEVEVNQQGEEASADAKSGAPPGGKKDQNAGEKKTQKITVMEALRHRSFSARDRMISGPDETIHTKVLSRRETTKDEAESWLVAGDAGEAARSAVGQGRGLAVTMRETGHFLRAAGEYLERSHPKVATSATRTADDLEAVDPGRSDRIAPDVWPKAAKPAAKTMDDVVKGLSEVELNGLARIGTRIGEDLRDQVAEWTAAKKGAVAQSEAGGSGRSVKKAAGRASANRRSQAQRRRSAEDVQSQ